MAAHQLIDAQGSFTGTLPTTNPTLQNYQVTAVVGCQSGGKSTLLNRAFATSFPVLDAPKSGRRRTTLGIWAACHPQHVILDVEGTDSRERGDGARQFESATTLFALALADIVVVNMWAHDVGRHSAANYDLFETVFAHSIRLHSSGVFKRVRVVIVVRDHDGEADIADIKRVLMGDLQNIWDSLRTNANFKEFFDVRVAALPHIAYAKEKFEQAVKELAESITRDPPVQLVPLGGFEALAKTVWSAIRRSTGGTLDLPKHASLAAYYSVGETVTNLLQGDVAAQLHELREELEAGYRPLADFGPRIDAIAKSALKRFDSETRGYSKVASDVVKSRREELGGALTGQITEIRERYLSICRDYCMNGFEDDFRPMLGGTAGFDRSARRLANSFVAKYRNLLENGRMPSILSRFVAEERVEEERTDGDDGIPVTEENFDPLDAEYGLLDDDDDLEEFSAERFKRDVFRMVEERRRLGEIMLPGNGMPIAAPKRDPWWKGILIRAAILLINYLQATHAQRAALKLHRKHEKEFPPGPTF